MKPQSEWMDADLTETIRSVMEDNYDLGNRMITQVIGSSTIISA
jgi:hypothetical protein